MYEVSNKGNVKSIDRIIEDCIGRKKLYKGKILKKKSLYMDIIKYLYIKMVKQNYFLFIG